MRELVYKDMLGANPCKREISIEEIVSWSDIQGTPETKGQFSKKRLCKYFIESKFSSEEDESLRNWITQMKKERVSRKDCHIMRQFNTRTGENKIVCKVLGDFYIIAGKTVYKIAYINEVKVEVCDKKEKS
ncbi:MAG: hypothetical protein ABH844_07045 [Candidatus Omnitrophota bacterium]